MDNKRDNSSNLHAPYMFEISRETIEIFMWIAYCGVCQVICVFGIVTNTFSIMCFFKQGFKEPIDVSLLGLSISDLGCLITLSMTIAFFTPAVSAADLPFEAMEVNYLVATTPHLSFTRITSWITALITLERCVCVITPMKIKELVTSTRMAVIIVIVYAVNLFSLFPIFYVNKLGMKYSIARNKTLFGLISLDTRQHVEYISFIVNNFIVPLVAFIIILACTLLLTFKLKKTSKWRKSVTTSLVNTIGNRHQKVSKMVVTISSVFIVSFIPNCICLLAIAIEPALHVNGKYFSVSIIVGGFGFILESLNSSVNIFIYYNMSSKYRAMFLRIFSRR